jgi:hypothetical protein
MFADLSRLIDSVMLDFALSMIANNIRNHSRNYKKKGIHNEGATDSYYEAEEEPGSFSKINQVFSTV